LLQETRYITGVSGGAWASAVYSYYNPAAGPHAPQNDSELLGRYYPPELLDDQVLQQLSERSAHFASTRGLATDLEGVAAADWVKQIEEVFLKPVGIPTGDRASFTWDVASAEAIAQRNPDFIDTSSLAVVQRRPWGSPPYMILGLTLLAPLDVAPQRLVNRSYTVMDATPLYFGQSRIAPVTYYPRTPLFPPYPRPQTHNVSGLLQPFAFGGEAPATALPADVNEALLQLPSPARPFSLGRAVGASSFFPADVLADFSRDLAASLGFVHPFWPPAGSAPATQFMLGDGGLCENTLVTSLLRRKVKRIVWFVSRLDVSTS
jgi:hypothetical protein